MVHFNDILGSLPLFQLCLWGESYPIICLRGNWKSVPQQGCIFNEHHWCQTLGAVRFIV